MKRMSHFYFNKQSPSFIIAGLVVGAVLAVGGSVLATSVGNSIIVTSNLTVNGTSVLTGNTGIGTTTAGTLLSVQGIGNWAGGGSTIYSTITFPSFTATSTSASNGIGTSTPGTTFSIQGVGNFISAATSTLYTPLMLSNFTATSSVLLATNTGFVGIATTSPGSLFSIQGIGNFVSAATSTLYTDLFARSFSATSTIYHADGTAAVPSFAFINSPATGLFRGGTNILGFATAGTEQARIDASGNFGIGTTTPGSLLALGTMANFVSNSTSTLANGLTVGTLLATSTTATSTFANGLLIGTTKGSVGIATTTPANTFSLGGDALIGAGANGTSTLVVNSSATGVGSCIQMRAASSSDMYRIYIGKSIDGVGSTTGLTVEKGSCR